MMQIKMNSKLAKLQPYPFEKLAALFAECTANSELSPIALTVGEPKHPSPEFALETFSSERHRLANYPSTIGLPALRESIAAWLQQRFKLESICANKQVLPCNGTREALFAFAQAVFDTDNSSKPYILSPNPFYQIYEGAAYLAGAKPYFIKLDTKSKLADLDSIPHEIWQQTQLIFLCSPGNPTGAVVPAEQIQRLLTLSDQYNFIIASDECYSEIYFKEKPIGLLEVCAQMGRHDYKNAVVFHSLSKRSNLPGLRSGFVAGDAEVLAAFKLYRTYHGCAMSIPNQLASITAWQDEKHVTDNRALYLEKFQAVFAILKDVLPIQMPDASFYFWLPTPEDDRLFAQKLLTQQNVKVLPGQYLSRTVDNDNPGQNYVRVALVAELHECVQAAERIKRFIMENYPA